MDVTAEPSSRKINVATCEWTELNCSISMGGCSIKHIAAAQAIADFKARLAKD
jgi:hypothetical protein